MAMYSQRSSLKARPPLLPLLLLREAAPGPLPAAGQYQMCGMAPTWQPMQSMQLPASGSQASQPVRNAS
eukprot:COSAG04_NODE_21015_length_382_cov_0.371025_1_plen_68_part_01